MRKIIATLAGVALLSGCAAGGTPQSCLDALDAAEEVMGLSAQAMGVMTDALRDPSRMGEYSERLEGVNAELLASRYPTLAQQCRGGK